MFADPGELVKLWEGGMSFHGGMIGTVLAIAWVSWRNKLNFVRVCDYIAVCVPFGLLFGRLANFVNGELWGRVTTSTVPWVMIFPGAGPSRAIPASLRGAARRPGAGRAADHAVLEDPRALAAGSAGRAVHAGLRPVASPWNTSANRTRSLRNRPQHRLLDGPVADHADDGGGPVLLHSRAGSPSAFGPEAGNRAGRHRVTGGPRRPGTIVRSPRRSPA
jgi:hypothetical protein